MHLVGSDCPALRSISGKTLNIVGKRIVELDCGGHSIRIHFYVYEGIPFPLVSISRFQSQDFLTIMSRDYMALLTPHGNFVPILRQGILVYLTPSIIPFAQAIIPTTEIEICSLLDDIDLLGLTGNLRGVSDIIDGSYDHMSRIIELIAATKDKDKFHRSRPDQKYHNMDWWSLDEIALTLTRHHIKPRNALHILNRTWTALPL